MVVSETPSSEKVGEFRRALLMHVEEQAYANVEFIECIDPPYDPNVDDYRLAYQATFQPRDLKHAQLEIWITDQAYVGILFETRARLAERLGRRLWQGKGAIAAGRELSPGLIPPCELIAFVKLVARGEVFLKVGFDFLQLGATKAVMSEKSYNSLCTINPRGWDWLTVKTEQEIAKERTKLVAFEPW